MDLLALIWGVIFFHLAQGGSIWDYLARVLLDTQEVLEDADNCGILGQSRSRSLEANSGSDGCLSDCTWKENPFYKTVDVHNSKLNDKRSSESAFQFLYTSAFVPTDLNCLSDCFAAYQPDQESQELDSMRLNCSGNGLDTLIDTSNKYGVLFIASNYSDMDMWSKVTTNDFDNDDIFYRLASRDPRLDCFLYFYKTLRTEGDTVSNFIESDSVDGNAGSSDTSTLLDTSNTDVSRFFFRASSSFQTAVEICVLAKRQARLKAVDANKPWLNLTVTDIFGTTTPTCDHFLPDIFAPTSCQCVGTCASSTTKRRSGLPKNHLDHFAAKEGIVGCQNACKKNERCNFFTYSQSNMNGTKLSFGICWLWKSCQEFRIPDRSTTYYREGSWVISDHWSAPKDCRDQKKTTCPNLVCKETNHTVNNLFNY